MKAHRFKLLKENIINIYNTHDVKNPIWWSGALFLELTKKQMNQLMDHIGMLEQLHAYDPGYQPICGVEYMREDVYRVEIPSGIIFRRY